MRRVLFLALSVLLSCGGISADAMATQILRVGMSASMESDQGLFARRFKAIAEELSNNELRVSLFADGAFGADLDLLEHLQAGHLAVVTVSAGNAVSAVEELGTLVLPGLVETHEEAVKATTGRLGQSWNDLCLKKGAFRILGWSYSGTRTVYTFAPLPESPEAIRDLVVCAAFVEWQVDSASTTGAGEALTDSNRLPLYRYYSMHPFVMGEASWRRLSPGLQCILIHAGRDAQQYAMLMQAQRPVSREETHIRPALTHEQLQAWVWPEFYGLIGGRGPITRTLDAINWR